MIGLRNNPDIDSVKNLWLGFLLIVYEKVSFAKENLLTAILKILN